MSAYDAAVTADGPVAYWPLNDSPRTTLTAAVGALSGTYTGSPAATLLPNGDAAVVFNGASQYAEIPDSSLFSVTRTGRLTVEAWMRPDTLEFPNDESTGYVHWLGKGTSGQHEWALRMYSFTNTEAPPRPNRVSGYAFNSAGGLGAGSYFQDAAIVGQWIHVALVINTADTTPSYTTGYTKIFKNGALRDTDALSEFSIVPSDGTAPLRIGTRDLGSFFQGAVGKVAVYDYELTAAQLAAHRRVMTLPTRLRRIVIGGAPRAVDLLRAYTPPPSAPLAGVWAVDSLTRVGKTAPAGSGASVALTMVRRETASFQVVVNGGATGVPNVELTVSDLAGADGTISAAANITRYREHYVNVHTASELWDNSTNPSSGAGLYPDALIPFVHPDTGIDLDGTIKANQFDVAAGENQPYWVDVHIPAGTAAGTYTGAYTITSGSRSTTGAVTVDVIAATLPLAPTLRTGFLHWEGRASTERELLRHRISPADVPAASVASYAATYGLTAANTGFWSGADISTCTMNTAPSTASITTAATARNTSGVLLYNYSADEIDACPNLDDDLQAWARNLHDATPPVKQLVTMVPKPALHSDGDGGFGVDIWVVLPYQYQDNTSAITTARGLGMDTWSYSALNQDGYSPKWLIDFDHADARVHAGFLNEKTGMTGMLYWRVDLWATTERWGNVYNYDPDAYPGDGMLVYPGEEVGITDGTCPSIRLKWIRDGITDYEYIKLAKDAGQTTAANNAVNTVCTDWSNWSKSATTIKAARAALAGLLVSAAAIDSGVLDSSTLS